MRWNKVVKALLFPPMALTVLLLPVATVFLVYSMVRLGSQSPIAIASYVVAAYTLTVWCVRIPYLIRWFKTFKAENKYARRWLDDDRLRMNVSLYGSMIWNCAYALFQLWLGVYHGSFWFYSMAGYYISLGVMRFFLVRYTRRHEAGEDLRAELTRYRACGWVFLIMNLALSLMVFFMVYWNRTFYHHEITTIMMAAYTFFAFTIAIVNMVKYRKYNSPVYSASKAINMAAACVSMLTLESTMLTTFGDEGMDALTRKIMLGTSGGVISAVIVAMAVYMIVHSNKKMKSIKSEVKSNGEQ